MEKLRPVDSVSDSVVAYLMSRQAATSLELEGQRRRLETCSYFRLFGLTGLVRNRLLKNVSDLGLRQAEYHASALALQFDHRASPAEDRLLEDLAAGLDIKTAFQLLHALNPDRAHAYLRRYPKQARLLT